jgi:FAD/FMN-containing dehydrogenase
MTSLATSAGAAPVDAARTPRPDFSGRWLTAPEDMAPFLTDWRRRWTGRAQAVAQPESAADVAQVVDWCRAQGRPIVPQGGNTGLSGGATADDSGRAVVLSLSRMNRVRAIDTLNDTITVDAGCTLLQVQEAARAAGRLFPLSLAAEGSCTIGGNLATNAGGVQVLRYGNARELCLGLEVVTAAGEIWDGLRGLRKDNTGYDLRDLFIGSEGTLGIITGAVLKLHPLPARQACAVVGVESPDRALELLQLARRRLGPTLTAFELFSSTCLDLVLRHVPSARRPFDTPSPWFVLVELSETDGGDADTQDSAALQGLLESAFEAGLVEDAAISTSIAQFEALWQLREGISEAQGAEGKTIKHDIAVPISAMARFLAEASAAVAEAAPELRLVAFGHLGDGNLHYNLSPPAGGVMTPAAFEAFEAPLNQRVHDLVARHHGSISAEHGLGVLRRDEARRYKSATETRLLRAIKQALDPEGLFNPGKALGAPD